MSFFGNGSAGGRNETYVQMGEDTEEIVLYDEELESLRKQIRNELDQLVRLRGPARIEKADYIRSRISRAKECFRSFRVELQEIPKVDLPHWEQKAKEHQSAISLLLSDVDEYGVDADREELMAGSSGQASSSDPDNMTAQQLLAQASDVQDESAKSVAKSKKMVEDAKKIGIETLQKMNDQTEQMKKIDEGLDAADKNMELANQLLRKFMQRMITDKIIACFMFLIVIGIIFILIYKMVAPAEDTENLNVPDGMLPPVD